MSKLSDIFEDVIAVGLLTTGVILAGSETTPNSRKWNVSDFEKSDKVENISVRDRYTLHRVIDQWSDWDYNSILKVWTHPVHTKFYGEDIKTSVWVDVSNPYRVKMSVKDKEVKLVCLNGEYVFVDSNGNLWRDINRY